MFRNCSELTSLDLSSFNTSQVSVMTEMFRKCSKLVTIEVSDNWTIAGLTTNNDSNMFAFCDKLKGGQGTEYNSTYVNKTYARIDKKDSTPSEPGYFTEGAARYTVTLNINGGIINSGNVTSYAEGTGATLPTSEQVTRTGYIFGGWN